MKSSLATALIAGTTLLFVACEQKSSPDKTAPQPKGSGSQMPKASDTQLPPSDKKADDKSASTTPDKPSATAPIEKASFKRPGKKELKETLNRTSFPKRILEQQKIRCLRRHYFRQGLVRIKLKIQIRNRLA